MPFIAHDDIDDPVEVAESAVRVLEKSGWRRVELADLTKSELLEQAEQRGIPTSKSATKAEIAEAIESQTQEA